MSLGRDLNLVPSKHEGGGVLPTGLRRLADVIFAAKYHMWEMLRIFILSDTEF
jgi:hypothetical protein